MSIPLKRPRYLDKTVEAILQLKSEKIRSDISVKIIRRLTGVEGTNRSAVWFYSRALAFLEREGILKVINDNMPKKYALIDEEKLKILVEG